MPANLTPQYYEAERVYKEAKTPQEKISAIENMLAIMPKHKGTDKLKADLRRKISQLKKDMAKKHGSKKSMGYDIKSEGAGQIILTGMPNSGKSSLINLLTNIGSEVAPYPYSTRFPIPAMMTYHNIKIQLIDIPPFTDEFAETWMNNILRNSDALSVIIDLTVDPIRELEESLKKIETYKIKPSANLEDIEGESPVIPKKILIIGNKMDMEDSEIGLELLQEAINGRFPLITISALSGMNMDELKEEFFKLLDIARVYSKAHYQQKVNFDAPFIMKKGSTVLDFAERVHKDLKASLQYARIWGSSEKYTGQRVNRDYVVCDEDIIELKVF
jgi:ribosome-interacting GTPase 1